MVASQLQHHDARRPHLRGPRVGSTIIAIAAAGTCLVAVASIGAAWIAGSSVPQTHGYLVSFDNQTTHRELGSATIPYGQYDHYEVNITDLCLSRFEARLDWKDDGRTPMQDPYVDLWIEHSTNPDLSGIAEIPESGGSVSVDIAGAVPQNSTIGAPSPDEALQAAFNATPNATAARGTWEVHLSTQAPSNWRPFLGGTVTYVLSLKLTQCKAAAVAS